MIRILFFGFLLVFGNDGAEVGVKKEENITTTTERHRAPYSKNKEDFIKRAFLNDNQSNNSISSLGEDAGTGVFENLAQFQSCANFAFIGIENVADGKYLDVEIFTVNGQPVLTWAWHAGENQMWFVNWDAIFDSEMGFYLTPVNQDWNGNAKVLSENIEDNTVSVWESDGSSNQFWWIKRVDSAISILWQIINIGTGRCLTSTETTRAKTAPCDFNETKQLWKILNL